MNLLSKIPVVGKTKYTTKVGVWRLRGDTFQFELHDAVRYRYDDRPNAHVLDTGEEIPAVPLEHIYTMSNGTPYFEVIEVEDAQYAPREKLLNQDSFNQEDIKAVIDEKDDQLVPYKAEVDKQDIKDNVIENKDQRLNFWLDHLKESDEKYGAAGLLRENLNLILVVATALGVGIIMYTAGDFSAVGDVLSSLNENVAELNQNLEALQEEGSDIPGG